MNNSHPINNQVSRDEQHAIISMNGGYAKFKNHPCFKDHWSGFEKIIPISVIIGKNNTGKSHLLQFVETLCESQLNDIKWDIQIGRNLEAPFLQMIFRPGVSSGQLGGDHWQNNGIRFIGETCIWTRENGQSRGLDFLKPTTHQDNSTSVTTENRVKVIEDGFYREPHLLHGKKFKHLLADRDIQPEKETSILALARNGNGATNIVRRFINSTDPKLSRDLIQVEMLKELNQVFAGDIRFDEITVRHHDGDHFTGVTANTWEIYLKQEHKGLVSLSNSGSGLKTIFLVLLNLLVLPKIEGHKLSDYVFAFEELENNLHPSILRNLLGLIRKKSIATQDSSTGATPHFFLTTHSSAALDYFADDEIAQIIHVTHNGKSAQTRTVDHNSKALEVIRELGTRPSDLLQANGILA